MKKYQKILYTVTAAVITAVCIFCVCFVVLYDPPQAESAAKNDKNTEYTPPAQKNECILINCSDCKNSAVLLLDFEEKNATLNLFPDGYNQDYGFDVTAKITVSKELVCKLADDAGGINFTLHRNTPILESGSWRLTGNQFWELLHLEDTTLYESLLLEYFKTVFTFGLQNNQMYIILNLNLSDGLSYSYLYNIAHYSKDWLSQLTVIS